MDGTNERTKKLQDDSFKPGSYLSLVPEPDHPSRKKGTAVAVFNSAGHLQVGYLPIKVSRYYSERLAAGRKFNCLSLWEELSDGGQRSELRILLVDMATNIKLPR